MIVGADVGGTFTDVVAVGETGVRTAKVPTTRMQSDGVAEGVVVVAAGAPIDSLVHGTTVATNALLERAGATVALVTDAGFEDVIEIARQDRPSLYDSFDDRPGPLVAREHRIGVVGIPDIIDVGEAEAVAVALIDGHIDRARERAISERVAGPSGVPVSLSSQVAPEFREYERTSTTVLNAYLMPLTAAYLDALGAALDRQTPVEGLAVMRSSGGLMSAPDAASLPAAILLSGPAGGVVAAAAFAMALGRGHVVSFDMGGTSTDVCRIVDGSVDVSYERSIDGYACRLPSVGIHTVGAGGGSIAWLDSGGALRVGPRSAGSIPGPACYGRGGTEPTVTDANLVLGRLDPSAALGGSVTLDASAAKRSVARVADPLGLTLEDAALGILAIAEDVMAGAIRTVSIEQGADPSTASLFAFGGAGGLHASSLAKTLGMAGAVIPPYGGVLSAVGLLLSPPRVDLARAVHGVDALDTVAVPARELADEAVEALAAAGHATSDVEHVLDVRYLGQAHEIGVPWRPGEPIAVVADRFGRLHRERNGFVRDDDPIEVVAVRCTAVGTPALTMEELGAWEPSCDRHDHRRMIVDVSGPVEALIVQRESLAIGDVIEGPAVIEEAQSTTLLHTGDRAVLHPTGALEVTW